MSARGPLLKPSEKGERRPTTSRSIAKGSRYEVLKQQIRGWWEDRFKVGEYLKEIRDGKLYKEEYATFEEFSEAEFEIKRSYAHRLIEAADVKESVKMLPIGNKLTYESQARALAPVPVEKREEVLTKVAERGPVTAKAITTTAKILTAAPKSAKEKQEFLDHVGRAVPDDLVSEWKRAEDVGKQLQSLARKIKSTVSEGFAGAKQEKLKDPIFAELTNSVISDAQALAWSLGSIIPFALCPTCQGRGRNSCALCRKRGWVSRFMWNSPVVNEDVRKMIEKGKTST